MRSSGLRAGPDVSRMISEYRIWGRVPSGFTKVSDGGGCRLIVRDDQRHVLSASSWNRAEGEAQSAQLQGRGKLGRIMLPNGEQVLLRRYHHGGAVRLVTDRVFYSWPPRPFRELMITEELRRRGVPTVEVYGACVETVWGPLYRGWLATRAIPKAQDLWAALCSGFMREAGEEMSLRAVAGSVRNLHRQGVYHDDLNLKNILLRRENGKVCAYIIDFDKAKLVLGSLPAPLARKNLDRLLRSARKLDPERRYLSAALWQAFVHFYYESDGSEA